ncbi:MAG: peptide chain release factor 3 [Candidatus Hydrogenedentes bacterium]|nr:peptide chain release factor 3 [Candidatus Hydrogenedentota bacterium]
MPVETAPANLSKEIARRRTFAIVSHPDAGKTTITEKFLLYGGAVHLAGSVTARRNQRASTSDWLELEQKRGISISSTVLQFDYDGYRVNLLDTPGHQDFSEDTYRVLTAVDAAIMVIDAGKGIEAQTLKLFEVCRHRGVPIFTFINKVDRPTLEPFELLDQLEQKLGLAPYAVNWPLGNGPDFRGVWDRHTKMAHLFERTTGNAQRAPVQTGGLDDDFVREQLTPETYETVCEEVEMLEGAGTEFDPADVLAAKTTPVYFGSALNNFGVQLLLDGFLKYSAPPESRKTTLGIEIEPSNPAFSGFVFKIQANMDPKHRDRIAFIRIVSGKFERNMTVIHARTGRKVRLGNASKIFGSERETVEEAYPGDVVGIVGNNLFAIGDTLSADGKMDYDEIPFFAPECYTYIENAQPVQAKRFRTGLSQLLQEGVMQQYRLPDAVRNVPLLGAAGPLQFEIVQYRLESEYGAETRLQAAPWIETRWVKSDTVDISRMPLPPGVRLAYDGQDCAVLLFETAWGMGYFAERNPEITLGTLPF